MERLSHQPIPQEADAHPDDAEQLAQLPVLWETVYGHRHGLLGLFSGTRVERRLQQPREVYYRYPDEVPAALAWVDAEARLDRELYHCGHLLLRPRRRKANAAPLATLYADVDDGELTALPVPPSALVESSPGRLQAYWRLTEAVAPAEGETLNRRIALAVNADKTGWDLTQLLRLPGTRNHKYAVAPTVRLLIVSDARYEPMALNHLLPPVPKQPTMEALPRIVAGPLTDAAADQPPVRLSRPALAVWRGEVAKLTDAGTIDRSASLIRIARVLYDAGLTREALPAALAERDVRLGWHKYTDRRDATQQYQAIVALVWQGPATRRHGR